jgi:hypothetical protein
MYAGLCHRPLRAEPRYPCLCAQGFSARLASSLWAARHSSLLGICGRTPDDAAGRVSQHDSGCLHSMGQWAHARRPCRLAAEQRSQRGVFTSCSVLGGTRSSHSQPVRHALETEDSASRRIIQVASGACRRSTVVVPHTHKLEDDLSSTNQGQRTSTLVGCTQSTSN